MRLIIILVLLLASVNAVGVPVKHEHQVYYQINGVTPQEMREQMNQLGPFDHGKRYDANTTWNIRWRYQYSDTEAGCKIENVRVSLDITYSLPEWNAYSTADTGLKEKWDKYLAKLRLHEGTHAANGEEAAGEIEYLLNNFPILRNCQLLGVHANNKAQDIIKKTNERDIEYDNNTHHGLTQGVVFP